MNKPDAEIRKAKEMAAEMENSLSYFNAFITNMEKFVTSIDVEEEKLVLPIGDKTVQQNPELYTIKTLATELGVCERTIRRYCNEGLIRYIQIRGKIRFSLKDVEDFYLDHYKEKF